MFIYCEGDIFASDADALINTVNCKGVMGKGLAADFKRNYPENYLNYRNECLNRRLTTGKLSVFDEKGKTIINFPTKDDWRKPSKLSYISEGLDSLAEYLNHSRIKSIAIPKLGCGLGGLEWTAVRPLIEEKLSNISKTIRIDIYGEPDLSSETTEPLKQLILKNVVQNLNRNPDIEVLAVACCFIDYFSMNPIFEAKLNTQSSKIEYGENTAQALHSILLNLTEHPKNSLDKSIPAIRISSDIKRAIRSTSFVLNEISVKRDLYILLVILSQLTGLGNSGLKTINKDEVLELIVRQLPRMVKDTAKKKTLELLDFLCELGYLAETLLGYEILGLSHNIYKDSIICKTIRPVVSVLDYESNSGKNAAEISERTTKEYLVSINTDELSELTKLPGIGKKTAEKIIEYRRKSGDFTSLEELKLVPGIKDKAFDAVKDKISI